MPHWGDLSECAVLISGTILWRERIKFKDQRTLRYAGNNRERSRESELECPAFD
jgi:hypothetical protein